MPGFNPGFGIGQGLGLSTLVWIIALLIIGGVILRERKGFVSGTPIVLKKFHINPDRNATNVIEIVGRAAGVLSWVLNLLRLEQDYELILTRSEVSIRRGSLSGIVHTYLPLNKVTGTVCGYQRSILAFILTALFAVAFVLTLLSGFFENNQNAVSSDMGFAFGLLIVASVFALWYFLSKRIGINIETMHTHGFVFKRSVIENVSVDLPHALEATSIINAMVLASQTAQSTSGGDSRGFLPDSSAPRAPHAPNAIPVCPRCSALNPSGMRFCQDCGAALPG